MKVKNKVIIVTGAGGGIGRALVLDLLKRGAFVAGVDLNENSLNETSNLTNEYAHHFKSYKVDITDLDEVEQLPKLILKDFQSIDAIINNAGIIHKFLPVEKLSFDQIRKVMDVNFYGTLYMVKTFLPILKKREEAHIVNISSMGGFIPVPGQTIYGASKAAVKLLTEGLHSELSSTSVRVTVVFPGGVETGIAKDLVENSDTKKSNYKLLKPEQAAKIIIDGMEKNKYRIRAGKDSTLMDRLYRLMPKTAAGLIAKQMKDLL